VITDCAGDTLPASTEGKVIFRRSSGGNAENFSIFDEINWFIPFLSEFSIQH
jgi:hypothetical protein